MTFHFKLVRKKCVSVATFWFGQKLFDILLLFFIFIFCVYQLSGKIKIHRNSFILWNFFHKSWLMKLIRFFNWKIKEKIWIISKNKFIVIFMWIFEIILVILWSWIKSHNYFFSFIKLPHNKYRIVKFLICFFWIFGLIYFVFLW